MKKMRKLIPALAMLLVSAIMMSTASFAWFTMNDNVTATGMSVQARAAGNLLISLNKMTAADQAITVNLDNTKQELTPITYNSGWKVPGDGVAVDPTFGTLASDTLKAATVSYTVNGSDYFADYVIYLATAGNDLTNQTLWVRIDGLSGTNQKIAPAYTIAFYIDENDDGVMEESEYATSVNYETYLTINGHAAATEATVKTGITIPSTYGATADSTKGLRIFMRVYVDGALEAEQTKEKVPNILAGTGVTYDKATMSGYIFYNALNEVVDNSMWNDGISLNDYTYWDGVTMKEGDLKDTMYVNNAWVPTGATNFSVVLGVKNP